MNKAKQTVRKNFRKNWQKSHVLKSFLRVLVGGGGGGVAVYPVRALALLFRSGNRECMMPNGFETEGRRFWIIH